MKKLLFLLLPALACGLVSCKGKDSPVSDTLKTHMETYKAVCMRRDIAMDPFNVAFRLNVWLEGGSSETLRGQLFPEATVKRNEDASYTLTYTESGTLPEKDLSRIGEVVIHTYGTLLSDENAVWQVTTNRDDIDLFYYVNYPDYGYWEIKLDRNEYVISRLAAGSYRVQADWIYLLDAYYSTSWNWDLDQVVTQTQGSAGDLAQARFRIEPGEGTSRGLMLSTETEPYRYRMDILEPLLYSAGCGYLQKNGGQERLLRMDNNGYKGLDSLIFDFGRNAGNCYPDFSLTAKAQADSVWTTHRYTWEGDWIRDDE